MIQRSPELVALTRNDEPEVADRTVRRRQLIAGGFLILAGVLAGYFTIARGRSQQDDMLSNDEEFSTTTFRPPSFVREPKEEKTEKPEIIRLPPPPPPPPPRAKKQAEPVDTTEFSVPPPPPPTLAPKPAAAAAVPDNFPERYRSKMIVLDNAQSSGGPLAAEDTKGQGTVAGEDRNSQFLAAAANLGDRAATARKIGRIDALVPEGTLIPGILETAIVSDLAGQVRAIVSEDVYSFDGRRVLIPTGTRLIGEYQSQIVRGQKRIFVIWTRMLRDDGVSIRLDSIGADSLGRSGLTGQIDNKFRERFGAAILLSIVGGGVGYLAGDGGRSAEGDGRQPLDGARGALAQTLSDMANQALGDSLKIPPTIRVAQGERIFVFVRQDLDFSSFYEDPVSEALREIRHERGLD